jgi:uncharacterized peroxidase-related enzyme
MPHLSPPTNEQASAAAQALFQKMQSKFGMVPNIFRTMGYAPKILEATLALNDAIQSDLDPKLRELAYLKASQINGCHYCSHYHRIFGRKAGLTDAQLNDLDKFEQSSAYSGLEQAVLRFAEQMTRRSKVSPEVLDVLKKSLTPSQIVVLAATVGLANWTNRFNETFGIELP